MSLILEVSKWRFWWIRYDCRWTMVILILILIPSSIEYHSSLTMNSTLFLIISSLLFPSLILYKSHCLPLTLIASLLHTNLVPYQSRAISLGWAPMSVTMTSYEICFMPPRTLTLLMFQSRLIVVMAVVLIVWKWGYSGCVHNIPLH